MKDVRAVGAHETCTLGDGILPIIDCVRAMRDINFTGPISIEHEPEHYDPAAEVESSRQRLLGWLQDTKVSFDALACSDRGSRGVSAGGGGGHVGTKIDEAIQAVMRIPVGGQVATAADSPAATCNIQSGGVVRLPSQLCILLLVALGLAFLLRFTDIGRNIYAIGGNFTAARLSGVNLNRYVMAVYILVGVVSATAGVILIARQGFGQQTGAVDGLGVKAVTVAALGGASLKGGRGGILGAVLAMILLAFLVNGMNVLNIKTSWQNVAQGLRLLIVVMAQQIRKGERASVSPADPTPAPTGDCSHCMISGMKS